MKSREEYRTAIENAFRRRDFMTAIQIAAEALQHYPDDPELTQLRERAQEKLEAEPFLQSFMASGISLFNSGLYEDALHQFEKVAAIDPDYPELQEWLERARAERQRQIAAEETIPLASTPSAESPTAEKVRELIEKGKTLYAEGRYHDAIQVWTDVFMYDLSNQEAQELIQQAQQKIATLKEEIETHLQQARDAIRAHRPEEARKSLETILQLDPNHAEARQLLASLEPAAAASAAPQVEDEIQSTEAPEKLITQALRAHREARWSEAVRLWQKVLSQDPDNVGAHTKYSEALRQLRIDNQFHKLLENARMFWVQGKRDSALHALQKAYRLRPDHDQIHTLLAEWQISVEELEQFLPPTGAETEAPPAPVTARARRLRWIIGGVLVLAIGGAVYTFYFHRASSAPQPPPKPPSRQSIFGPDVRVPTRPARRTAPAPVNSSTPAAQPAAEQPPAQPAETTEPRPTLTAEQAAARDRLIAEARTLYAQGELDAAYAKLEEALRIDPESSTARQLAAEINAAIQEREQRIQQRIRVAEDYYRSHDFDGAIALLNMLREEFPQRTDILEMLKRSYYNAALLYLRSLRCNTAQERLDVIFLLDPDETRFRDLYPIIRQCLRDRGLDPETRQSLFARSFLPLRETP